MAAQVEEGGQMAGGSADPLSLQGYWAPGGDCENLVLGGPVRLGSSWA